MAIAVEDVKDLVETNLAVPRIEACMRTAENMLVTYVDPVGSPLVTTAVRDDIKRWLSAHFVSIMDPDVKEESADGVRMVYRGSTDMGLDATMYGQQAKSIDPTGMLQKVGKSTRKRLAFRFSEPRDEASDP